MRAPRPEVDLLICHDCCCGTQKKHPGIDHEDLRARLRTCASDRVRVRTVECLDVCERSNVVVVRDHRRPRRERDTWLAQVLYPSQVTALTEWVADSAGPTALPEPLARHRFHPFKKIGKP